MSNGSEVEVVEETPAPPSRASTSAIPKRKGRLPTVSAQASLEPQAAPTSKKAKAPTSNGAGSSGSRVDQAAFEALRAENESLKTQLESAMEMASKFQEDFNKLQNLRFTKPETAMVNYIEEMETRERKLTEQYQQLLSEMPRLREFLQPGTLTVLTREETDQRLNSHKKEIQDLRKVIEEREVAIEEREATIEELKQTINSSRLELAEEVKRSSLLNAQLSERPPTSRASANDTDTSKNPIILAFYETLTNFKVHSVKKVKSDELGDVTELKCDCTTYGHSLFFKLELYQSPSPDGENLLDTVRFSPLGLNHEKDQAFLDGLDYLRDTFTFIKEGGPFDKQMWEFGNVVNKFMRRWREDPDAEEEGEEGEEGEEEEDDIEVLSAGDVST